MSTDQRDFLSFQTTSFSIEGDEAGGGVTSPNQNYFKRLRNHYSAHEEKKKNTRSKLYHPTFHVTVLNETKNLLVKIKNSETYHFSTCSVFSASRLTKRNKGPEMSERKTVTKFQTMLGPEFVKISKTRFFAKFFFEQKFFLHLFLKDVGNPS